MRFNLKKLILLIGFLTLTIFFIYRTDLKASAATVPNRESPVVVFNRFVLAILNIDTNLSKDTQLYQFSTIFYPRHHATAGDGQSLCGSAHAATGFRSPWGTRSLMAAGTCRQTERSSDCPRTRWPSGRSGT